MQIPRDGLIMTKWFLSKPIGNTVFSSLPQKDSHKEDNEEKRPRQNPGTSWALEAPKKEYEGGAAQSH